jgi:hypothetical protein
MLYSHLPLIRILYQNAFSTLLGDLGLDVFHLLVPDILHEFEVGIWKAVFTHLIRMLQSINEELVYELDQRSAYVLPATTSLHY